MKSKYRKGAPIAIVTLVAVAAIVAAYGCSQLRTTPSRGEIAGIAAAIKSTRSDLPTFPPPSRPPMGKGGSIR